MKIIHQSPADVKDAHSTIDWLIEHQLSSLYVVASFSSKIVKCFKLGFAESFNVLLRLLINHTSTQFLMFSIVFPTKELLIDLKNSVSNSLFAFSCSFVFSSMCFFSRGFVKRQWSLTLSLSNEVLKIQKCVSCLELRLSSPLKTIFLLKSNSLGISSMFSSNSSRMRATSSSSLFALHGVQAFLCLRSGSDTRGNTLLLSHPWRFDLVAACLSGSNVYLIREEH